MFQFLHVKMLKKTFIYFTAAVTAVIAVVAWIVLRQFAGNNIRIVEENNVYAVEHAKSILEQYRQIADEKFYNIYNNTQVTNDLLDYLTLSPEAYLSKRLDQFSPDGFTQSIRTYMRQVLSTNQPLMNVDLYSYLQKKVFSFEKQNPSVVQYDVGENDFYGLLGERNRFVIVRDVTDYENSKTIGMAAFSFDYSYLTRSIRQYNTGAIFAYDLRHVRLLNLTPQSALDMTGEEVVRLLDGDAPSGETGAGHRYQIFESLDGDYRFVTFINRADLLRNAATVTGIVILLSIVAFLLIEGVFVSRLGQEHKSLQMILTIMDKAKSGDFSLDPDIVYSKDEYGLIAKTLTDMISRLDKHIRREYLVKLQQKEAQMQILENQIKPHFLYNTLEMIRGISLQNENKKAADAIYSLGMLYRGVFREETVITLKKEADFAREYLNIMEIRMSGDFCYTIDLDERIENFKTVKFWIQPLIENFFIHGVKKTSPYNMLVVKGVKVEHGFELEIVDNGRGMPPERLRALNKKLGAAHPARPEGPAPVRKGGLGIVNVYDRLSSFYKRVDMRLVNNRTAGVTITITVKDDELLV